MANSIFATRPIANLRVPLYQISLRAPDAISSVFAGNTYTFPLAPQMLNKQVMTYNTIMDVFGPSATAGVQRIVDQFGQSLPIYTMRGTTGWKAHSMDGYIWDGVGSIQRIQGILAAHAQKNQQQIANGQGDNLYTLEFYDYFMEEYWQVVPIGPQGISQSADKPLFAYYNFTFACLRPVSALIPALAVDAVANLLGANGLAALSLTTSASGIYNSAVNQIGSAVSSVQSFASDTISTYL